jgi:hypothetical protein
MDLVSFETQQEYDWVKGFINGKDDLCSYAANVQMFNEDIAFFSPPRPFLLGINQIITTFIPLFVSFKIMFKTQREKKIVFLYNFFSVSLQLFKDSHPSEVHL